MYGIKFSFLYFGKCSQNLVPTYNILVIFILFKIIIHDCWYNFYVENVYLRNISLLYFKIIRKTVEIRV